MHSARSFLGCPGVDSLKGGEKVCCHFKLSSMSLSHTTSSKVFLGFWHSHGAILPEGPVLTLSTRWSKLFGNLIALLISWAVFRLYRILTAIIFYLIFKDRGSSFDNSMATTMVVNIQSPLDGIFATISRLRRRKAFILIFVAALSALLLSPAIVVGLSLLHTVQDAFYRTIVASLPSQRANYYSQPTTHFRASGLMRPSGISMETSPILPQILKRHCQQPSRLLPSPTSSNVLQVQPRAL